MKKIELENKLGKALIDNQKLKVDYSFLQTVEWFDMLNINKLKKNNLLLKYIIAWTYTWLLLWLIFTY